MNIDDSTVTVSSLHQSQTRTRDSSFRDSALPHPQMYLAMKCRDLWQDIQKKSSVYLFHYYETSEKDRCKLCCKTVVPKNVHSLTRPNRVVGDVLHMHF